MSRMRTAPRAKLIAWGIILLLLAGTAFMIFGTSTFREGRCTSLMETQFSQELSELMEQEEPFELSQCTYFAWDEAYIFESGFSPKEAYRIAGAEWTGAKWFWNYLVSHSVENQTEEGQVLMAFLKKGKPAACGIVELSAAFPEEGYWKLTPDDCLVKAVSQEGSVGLERVEQEE